MSTQTQDPPVSITSEIHDSNLPEPKEPRKMSRAEFTHRYHEKRNRGELFDGLGIYGWGGIEDLVLAYTARGVGSNIMFVGEAGSGKTSNARIILSALFGPENVRKVDTQFEDETSLGICDIPDLTANKMVTLKTDSSLTLFKGIILDELNRSNPSLQKIYLPVLEDRMISGHKMQAEPVFSTMNPLNSNYEGVEALDKALAERITAIIQVPEYQTMEKDDRLKILKAKSSRTKGGIILPKDAVNAFRAAIAACQDQYDSIHEILLNEASNYVDEILMQAHQRKINLQSSRTGQHIVENFLWLQTFRHIVYGAPLLQAIDDAAKKALKHSIVAELYTDPIEDLHVAAMHTAASPHLIKGEGLVVSAFNRIEDAFLAFAFAAGDQGKTLNETERNKLIVNAHSKIIADYDKNLKLLQTIDRIVSSAEVFDSARKGMGYQDQIITKAGEYLIDARAATLSKKLGYTASSNGNILEGNIDASGKHKSLLRRSRIKKALISLANKKHSEIKPVFDPSRQTSLAITPISNIILGKGIQFSEQTATSWFDVSAISEDPIFKLLSIAYLCMATVLKDHADVNASNFYETEDLVLELVRSRIEDWNRMQGAEAIDYILKKGNNNGNVRTTSIPG